MKKLTALALAITMLLTLLTGNISAVENEFVFGDGYSDYYWNSEFNLGVGEDLAQQGMYDIFPMTLDGPTSGQCGDNAYWYIDEDTKTLTIYGSGDMYDFNNGAPWKYSDFQSVCITDQVTSIGDYAFWCNHIIDSIEILSDVTIIGEGAFYDCESLKSITLPDSVTTIENHAFLASWLENITLSDSLCYIGDRAFDMCNLNSVDLPESLTYIGNSAFSRCNLESLNLPDSLTHIGAGAFADNDLISNVFISKDVTYIGSGAFSGIGSIVVDSNNPYYFVENDMLLTHEADGLRIIWIKPTLTGSLTLSSDITHICDIPEGITELAILGNIPDTNFGIPYSLESVTFASVPVISAAFAEHYKLSKVSLPDNLVEIQYDAFLWCTSLKEIVIPASVKSIADRAFGKTDSVYFEGNAPKVCGIDEPVGDNSSKKYDGTFGKTVTLYYRPGTTGWTDSPAYDSATGTWNGYNLRVWGDESQFSGQCGDNAFWNFDPATGVLNITGSGSIWTGESNWLYVYPWDKFKDQVTEVDFAYGITNVPQRAFDYFANLKNVSLSDTIQFIGDQAFYKCALSGNLTIPDSVTEIQSAAFGKNSITAVELPKGLTYFTGFDNNNISEIIIPEGVTEIEKWAIINNAPLAHVELPSTLTRIQYGAFASCSNLQEIIIPSNVNRIDFTAFGGSPNQKIYFEGNAPYTDEDGSYASIFDPTDTLYYKPGTTGWTDSPDYDPATGKWKGYTIKPWESGDPGKVTALYPANGTVDFGYDNQNYYKVGFETMSVTFDKVLLAGDKTGFNYETYAPLDFGKGNISIYRADGKLIWAASPTSFSQCAGDVKILSDGMTLEITPSSKYMLFDYDTEYYVVIDPGVIKFENGTTFAGIKKGEWTFTTVDEKLDHEHKSDGWESDDTSHWRTCEICGRKYDVEEHRRDDNCKCTVCGKTAHMPATIVVDAKEPTCISDGYTGDRYCLLCHKVVEPGEKIPAYGHDLHWVSDPNSSIHWETCKRCKAKLSFDNHKFENKKCVVCGAPERYTPKEFTDFVWTLVNKHRPDLNSLPSPRTFHISNANWCDQFVSQSASICGLNSIIYGSGSTGYGVKAIYDNIIKAGGTEIMNIGKGIYGEPQMGDIVIFDWPEGSGWSKTEVYQHIGIVVKVENGKVYTVHGNFHASSGIDNSYVCGPANSQLGVTACQANKSGFGQTWDIRYSKLASTKECGGRIYAYVRPNWSKEANGIATNVVITIPGYARFKITYGDEILSSPQQELMTLDLNAETEEYDSNNTSFGTYSIDENGNFVIVLDYHTDYGFEIYSVTNDKIDVDIKYLDFYDNILNEVSFKNVEVTDTTTIETSPFNEFGGYSLYLVDGDKDVIGWSADANETVTTPSAEFTEYLNYGEENQPDGEEPTAQPVLPTHNHAFTSWQYDSFYHWRSCVSCGLRTDVYQHEFVDDVCTVCGYTRETSEEPETVSDDDGTVEVEVPTEGKKVIEEVSGAITDSKRKR